MSKRVVKAWTLSGTFSPVSFHPCPPGEAGLPLDPFSRAFIIIPLACIAAVLAFLAWRAWKHRRPERVTAGVFVKIVPDITRKTWMLRHFPKRTGSICGGVDGKGELRLALRAVYLATWPAWRARS